MAKYQVLRRSYLNGAIFEEGAVVEIADKLEDGRPFTASDNLQKLDEVSAAAETPDDLVQGSPPASKSKR